MASKTGLGSSTLWGLTPGTNLLTFLDDETLMEADTKDKAINVLLLGQSDCRHLFKTLEEHLSFRTREIKINVFIIESSMELYARQLLFLAHSAVPLEKIGLHEKTQQFLEFYGNTHIRPRSKHTLIRLSNMLIKMISDEEVMDQQLPFVNINDLKFIERDALVEIFKYWSECCDAKVENLTEKWDKRLRIYLGTRYDSRARIFDWDYHMRLCEQGISIISAPEYKNWRASGMAFVDDDSDYSQPNVTLLSPSGASSELNPKTSAFLGEIITGPFIAYGIECEDKSMFEKSNDRHRHSSMEVTVRNVEKVFRSLGTVEMQQKTVGKDEKGAGDGNKKEKKKLIGDMVTVTFLPMESAKHLYLRQEFNRKFQLVYFGSGMAQHLTPEMGRVFGPKCIVVVESVRYILELRKEHMNAYTDKVEDLAKKLNLFKLSGDGESYGSDHLCFTPVPQSPEKSKMEEKSEDSSDIVTPVSTACDQVGLVPSSSLLPSSDTINTDDWTEVEQ